MARRSTRRPAVKDETTKKATGKTLTQWFAVLDRVGAKKMKHHDIAVLLEKKYKISLWWCQAVTVEYKYARHLRTNALPRMHPESKKALSAHPEAARAFTVIPPSHQREYLEYVAEAKKPETRERRVKKSVEMLEAWMKRQMR